MNEKDIRKMLDLFRPADHNPAFTIWDKRTGVKTLLRPSHDEANVCCYEVLSPLFSEQQKADAQRVLDELADDEEEQD